MTLEKCIKTENQKEHYHQAPLRAVSQQVLSNPFRLPRAWPASRRFHQSLAITTNNAPRPRINMRLVSNVIGEGSRSTGLVKLTYSTRGTSAAANIGAIRAWQIRAAATGS